MILCLLWGALVACACLAGADAALTKQKQVKVEFLSTFANQDFECVSESSHEYFTHAIITLASSNGFDPSPLFVTISSSSSQSSICSQYGGGDYEHEGCAVAAHALASLSTDSGQMEVSVPLNIHKHSFDSEDEGVTWTICVGNGNGSIDNAPNKDTAGALLHAAGSVLLSSSTTNSLHMPTSNAANPAQQKGQSSRASPQTSTGKHEGRHHVAESGGNRNYKGKGTKAKVIPVLSVPPSAVIFEDDNSRSGGEKHPRGNDGSIRAQSAPSACVVESYYADGYCDPENNVADCNYDGGDCCYEDCMDDSYCFDLLSSYPKVCHKDETVTVNHMGEHSGTSTLYCAPSYDVASNGAWCNLRTAVEFCQSNVVGENHRCIVEIPAGTLDVTEAITLDDNGRSLVIRGNSSDSTVITGNLGSRFLDIDFADDHSSSTEFVLEHVAVVDFTAGAGGAISCKYLKQGAFTDVYFYNNHASYGSGGGGMLAQMVENVVYSNLTFEGCSASGEGGGMLVLSDVDMVATYINMKFVSNFGTGHYSAGGGLFITGQDFTIINSTFVGNQAAFGGGFAAEKSANLAKLQNVTLYSNIATKFGGGLHVQDFSSTVVVEDCAFIGNSAESIGGGIFANGYMGYDKTFEYTLYDYIFLIDFGAWQDEYGYGYYGGVEGGYDLNIVVEGTLFRNNEANNGGAMFNKAVTSLACTRCVFDDNVAYNDGGAVKFYVPATSSFVDSDFRRNIAGRYAGGIDFPSGGTYSIVNCNFTSNFADYGAAFLDYSNSYATIADSNFAKNEAIEGVIYILDGYGYIFTNCVFQQNIASDDGVLLMKDMVNLVVKDCQVLNNKNLYESGGAFYFTEGYGISFISTLFVGNEADVVGGAIAFDQDGYDYSIHNCTFIANSAQLYGGAIYSVYNQVLSISNSTFVDNYGVNYGGGLYISISDFVDITSCVFRDNKSPQGAGVILYELNDDVTITNCDFQYNVADFGGAVQGYNDNKDVVVVNNIFANNFVVNDGGALSLVGNSIRWTFDNNTFRNNSAENGGAVSIGSKSEDGIFSNNHFWGNSAINQGGAMSVTTLNDDLQVENNQFHHNTAKLGGALYFSTTNLNVHISDCHFTENFASYFGGAVMFAQQHTGLLLSRSTFLLNSAITSGGAVYLGFSVTNSLVTECDFQENSVLDYGGGALAMASFNNIDVTNCNFQDNHAYYGGAIFTLLKAERFNMVNSSVHLNTASFGGGLYIGAISEEVTLTSVEISLNSASQSGGGVYVDVLSKVSLSESVFHSNTAVFRGGALFYDSNELTVNSSMFENNAALDKGGAMFVRGDEIAISGGTTMKDNTARFDGGSLYLESSHDISVENVFFVGNFADGNGGACVLSDVSTINITRVSFSDNAATLSGGAMYTVLAKDVLVQESYVESNEAGGTGGGFAVSQCNNFSLSESHFVNNTATGGSAFWTSQSSVNLNSNVFSHNTNPKAGGTVLWDYASGMEEPSGLLTANTFHFNSALYGTDYATEAVSVTIDTEATRNETDDSFIISEYGTPIIVNAIIHDHYNQQVLSDSSTFLQINLAGEHSCGDKLPTLSGSTLEQVQSGACKFEAMYGFCNPGGFMEVKVGDVESTTSLESPFMKWSFRQCLRGEYYRDGECNWCEQGFYSKKENLDLSVTDCKRCPVDAKECFADTIVLNEGFWALSADSEGMTECPMGENGCKGGVQLATGQEEVQVVTSTDTGGGLQAAVQLEEQKQHLLHHRTTTFESSSPEEEYTTLDSTRVYDSTSSNSSGICHDGYTGVLCAICDVDYYYSPGGNSCEPCEAGGINTFTIVLMCVVGLLLCIPVGLLVLSWTGSSTLDTIITNLSVPALMYMFYMKFCVVKKAAEDETEAERCQREEKLNTMFLRIMPKFKIFISMAQITSSMPAVLGMAFPPFFTRVTSVFGLLNLDIVSNLGLSCQFKEVDYVDYLIMTCVAPMICSAFLCLVYNCHRLVLKRRRVHYEEVAKVYAKYLLVFLMGTYLGLPNISVYIFQMFSCQDIDPDDAIAGEDLYLRADLSIKCGSPRHVTGTTFATLMIFVYPIGVPLMYYWMLYNVKEGVMNRNENISPKLRLEIVPSSFLYSSYEPKFWYWEIVETIRRIMMTGVIVLVAQGTSLQIVVTMMLSLFFIKMYSYFAPFDDDILDVDAEFAQYQVYFVLLIALLIKEESIPAMEDIWGILLIFIIFSLLLLSPFRLFRDKCLPEKLQHFGEFDAEKNLEMLHKKEAAAENDDDAWNEDLGIDSDSEYHTSAKFKVDEEQGGGSNVNNFESNSSDSDGDGYGKCDDDNNDGEDGNTDNKNSNDIYDVCSKVVKRASSSGECRDKPRPAVSPRPHSSGKKAGAVYPTFENDNNLEL